MKKRSRGKTIMADVKTQTRPLDALKAITVPEDEAWLWQNQTALAMVLEGIEQSKNGQGRYFGTFAEFAHRPPDAKLPN